MADVERDIEQKQKKSRLTDREYNTATYLLRCVQLGLSDDDMEHLTYGMVIDLFTESGNDDCKYHYLATQEDIDNL